MAGWQTAPRISPRPRAIALAPASIPLPPLGTLGLDPGSLVVLQPFAIPQPAGVGSVRIPVPNDPTLIGLEFFSQTLVIRSPGQDRLSNVIRSVVR